jgi:beta-lactamase class A
MNRSRREFLAATGMTLAAGSSTKALAWKGTSPQKAATPAEILDLFHSVPGDVAIKIHAPAANGKPEFLVESKSSKKMFVGSAIKTFILCEVLRQADSPNVVQTLKQEQLDLNASVWSLDSATFNPPNLIGKVSLRTALEAMIMHSDNTGTDMCLKHAGPDKVRQFIASIGLKNTLIPDATRSLFGYMLGAKGYKNFSWEDIQVAANAPLVNSPMNDVESMVSTGDDFQSYYSRALQGEFFKTKETLNEFRPILSIGDAIWLLPLPLGCSSFCKGGSIDVAGYHAIAAPGAMFFDNRWLYFFVAINWYSKEEHDPSTAIAFADAASRALALAKDTVA